jgi:hypothetical protein
MSDVMPATAAGAGQHDARSLTQLLNEMRAAFAPAEGTAERADVVAEEGTKQGAVTAPETAPRVVPTPPPAYLTQEPARAAAESRPEQRRPLRRVASAVLGTFFAVSVDPEARSEVSIIFGGTDADARRTTASAR